MSPAFLTDAMRHLASGAWHEAEAAAQAALAKAPDDTRATLLLGLAVAAMGEDGRAAPFLLQAAAADCDAAHPCADLTRLQPPLPRALIARQFRACLRASSSSSVCDNRLRLAFAEFLLDTSQPAEAQTVLAGASISAASLHLMGLAQAEQDKFQAAIDSFQHAVALNPAAAASWSNLGMMLKVEGKFAEAIAAHDQAVTLCPCDARYLVNRAVALLMAQRWEVAWKDYEARLNLSQQSAIDPARLMPSLHPGDRLRGLTVLALHEDGFGDTLQFLRYLPLLADRGARVVACVPASLARVMRRVPGVAEVITDIRHVPLYDFVCPMFSLPRVFGTTVSTIPAVPKLAADTELTNYWAQRLPTQGLRVGLVWAGQARPSLPGFGTLDRRRSAGLAAFQPLFDVPGLSFVSLQAGPAAGQRHPKERVSRDPNTPETRPNDVGRSAVFVDPMPDVADFADTAAIIAALDVVVSVDTSVVHLAGLVGKPVLLLDRYDGCWRWLSGRQDTAWYPGLTIFRQDQPGDWSAPIARVAAALNAMAMCRGSGSPAYGLKDKAFVA